MKGIIAVLTLALSTLSFGGEKTSDVDMRVMIMDQNLREDQFPSYVKFDSTKPKLGFSRERRDSQFEKIKLSLYVDQLEMDELDRDLLYLALKNYQFERLVNKYPRIPAEVLQFAKNNFIF
ncbi:MAG: hypothetical protein H7Z71_01815 [Moraxellaceae bacterium]|nr:hypothetical protein [Pseudobdellovibrionaceae bacterium]